MPAIGVIRATEIKESLSDYQALTLTLFGEAQGLTDEGKFAVACVIRNRLRKKFRGARTIKDVCLSRLQFSCWFEVGGVKNYNRLMETAEIMAEEPRESWPSALLRCSAVATKALRPTEPDIVDGATHYYLEGTPEPPWTKPPAVLTVEVGGHLFYRDVK